MRSTRGMIPVCLCAGLLGCGRVGYEASALLSDAAAGGSDSPTADVVSADVRLVDAVAPADAAAIDTRPDASSVVDSAGVDVAAGADGRREVSPDDTAAGPDVGGDGLGEDARADGTHLGDAGDVSPESQPAGCLGRYPGAVFCDDFEQGLTVTTDYHPVTSRNGTVALETTEVRQGTSAVRMLPGEIVAQVTPTRLAFLEKRLSSPVVSGDLFVRAHMYLAADFTIRDWVIPLELTAGEARVKMTYLSDGRVVFQVTPASFSRSARAGSWPRGRWACVEVNLRVAGDATGRAELLVDGESKVVMDMGTTLPPGGWGVVRFGLLTDELTVGARAFVDDVVVSTTRIGCP